jgi:hypothetical protein
MEMAVRSMETAEMAMETDGDGSGALPRPGRVSEQRLLSPKICQRRSYGTLSGKLPTLLGFSVPRLYIGEGASSTGKIGVLELVSSNSENISCVALLKHKNSRKQGTGTVASCQ